MGNRWRGMKGGFGAHSRRGKSFLGLRLSRRKPRDRSAAEDATNRDPHNFRQASTPVTAA